MPKYLPHGTTVEFGSVPIGGLLGVMPPQRSRGSAETTDGDSAGVREWIAALAEGGEVTIRVRKDPEDAGQQALLADLDAAPGSAGEEVVIQTPSASTAGAHDHRWTFDAHVTGVTPGDHAQDADEVATEDYTLKVESGVTEAVV